MDTLNFGTQYNRRLVFKQLQEKYPKKQVSDSYLRSEVQIANSPQAAFEISSDNVTTTTRNVTERRLNRNDLFVATELGIFIKAVTSSGHAQSLLYTYPCPAAFVTDGSNFIREHLEAIYNGSLQVKSGAIVAIEAMDMRQFRYAPELPQGTVTAAIAGPVTYPIATEGAQGNVGMVQLPSYLYLSGTQQYEIGVNIPNGAALKIDNTNANVENWLVLVAKGFLVKNANFGG